MSSAGGEKSSLLPSLPDAHRRAASPVVITLCFISLQEKQNPTSGCPGSGKHQEFITELILGFVHIALPPFHLPPEPPD